MSGEAKLPVQQLVILAIARFAEPLALTSIFPYLPEMIRSFGVSENEIAKWAGFTSAVFSLAQSFTAVAWGRASDRFGRKPTIVFGLATTMIMFVIWGVSTSLPMAITVRVLAGAGNGNVGIIRTMVAEMVTERHLQPRAFSVMPLVWSLGSIFGPAFGGMLANPAERFPGLFGHSAFFKAYPFALPNIILAVFFLISLATAIFFLKETLETRRGQRDWGLLIGKKMTRALRPSRKPTSRPRRASFMDGEATAPLLPTDMSPKASSSHQTAPQSTMKDVFTTQTVIGLVAYTFLALHAVAFDQVLPAFLDYPVREQTPENRSLPFRFSGGFGLKSDSIGTMFAAYGISCGLTQFLLFPPLCNRLGVRNCYRCCAIAFPLVYLLVPYTVLLPTTNTRLAGMISLMCVKGFAGIIGFPCVTILLTNSASNLRILGTLNGFATMFSGFGRALGPTFAGAAFTWGVERGYVVTAWWLLALVAALGAVPAFMLVEGQGPSSSVESSDDERDEDGEQAIIDEDSEDDNAAVGAPLLLGPSHATGNGSVRRAGYDSISQSR
ncbi:MFS general substrate transporter [Sodiomyces alkalinus F11]|uniref:MFS general substrate transporter n=1 Tax=Sodiomyces alkalinus (strain CBS 110278 / VKM F-3762 / F11) TaxID=1314773 RepID=A0A3N2Q681_SODAK|nr:MFS general substrate transporter [Sodiomyces alkalinus F11]ROT42250.1 MFS general substrate transporter [Sodiomyces alkalinus F11]